MTVVGIDLGTTNTVAAIAGEALVQQSERSPFLPSVVAFPPSGATLVGNKARRRRVIDPTNTIFSAKRLIGRSWESPDTTEFRRRYPHEVVEQQQQPSFRTRAGIFTPSQISATVLQAVAKGLREPADQVMAILTVPSLFKQQHRDATLEAARLAGFTNVEIVNEPVAVARAYVQQLAARPRLAAVYDLGGGTFDLAIVDCTTTPLRVLAHGGDLYLGGDDIDTALTAWATGAVLQEHSWDLSTDPGVAARLTVECERAKIRLQHERETTLDLTQVDPSAPSNCRSIALTSDLLEKTTNDLLRRTFVVCDQTVADLGIPARDIEAVFSAGGTTLLPTIRRGIAHYFGCPVLDAINPMQVVAIGASLSL